MIYIFGATIIYTFIKQKNQLLREKRNLFLYLLLSVIGMSLGIIYIMNPYLPSIAMLMEKYMK